IMALADGLARRFAERATKNDPASVFPRENYRELHEAGYLRLMLPRQHGGDDASVFDMVLAQEVLGRGCASTALVTGMLMSVIGRVAESRAWPEPVFAEVCGAIAKDGGMVSNCVTEPELGSISRGGLPGMRAEPVDGGWRLIGRKIFVTGAPVLRFFVTAVTLPPSAVAPQGELAHALAEAGPPALRVVDARSGAPRPRCP